MVKQGVEFVYGKSSAVVVLVKEDECLILSEGRTTWIHKSIINIKLKGWLNGL